MEQKINTVDLGKFLADGEYDFSSRARGIAVRTGSNIDQLIEVCDQVEIIIPVQVYTMSTSFWKELLGNAILDNGKEKFYAKVKFISHGRYQPMQEIEAIVDEISRLVTGK